MLSKDEEKAMRNQNEAMRGEIDKLGLAVQDLTAENHRLRSQLAGSTSDSGSSPAPDISIPVLDSKLFAGRNMAVQYRDEDLSSDDDDLPDSDSDEESVNSYLIEHQVSRLDGREDLFVSSSSVFHIA